jgi:hypothetical protein
MRRVIAIGLNSSERSDRVIAEGFQKALRLEGQELTDIQKSEINEAFDFYEQGKERFE